jgi:hypothetical protein
MDWRTIVAADESISPVANDTSFGELLTSLKRDVHVAINGLQITCAMSETAALQHVSSHKPL